MIVKWREMKVNINEYQLEILDETRKQMKKYKIL